jgi:hypothetical protein
LEALFQFSASSIGAKKTEDAVQCEISGNITIRLSAKLNFLEGRRRLFGPV